MTINRGDWKVIVIDQGRRSMHKCVRYTEYLQYCGVLQVLTGGRNSRFPLWRYVYQLRERGKPENHRRPQKTSRWSVCDHRIPEKSEILREMINVTLNWPPVAKQMQTSDATSGVCSPRNWCFRVIKKANCTMTAGRCQLKTAHAAAW